MEPAGMALWMSLRLVGSGPSSAKVSVGNTRIARIAYRKNRVMPCQTSARAGLARETPQAGDSPAGLGAGLWGFGSLNALELQGAHRFGLQIHHADAVGIGVGDV